jgi:hypothetical protein
MSRLKRTFCAVVFVLLLAPGFAPAAHASEPVTPRLALWQHVWTQLSALWEEPVSRWLGGRPTVEKIGTGIDPDGAQAPTSTKPATDIGMGIDPNG